jgi:hypothetical protein
MVYLVEAFRSRVATGEPSGPELTAQLARLDARLIGRLSVPADEVVFWLVEADSPDGLGAAFAAAEIAGNRISEVGDLALVSTGTW